MQRTVFHSSSVKCWSFNGRNGEPYSSSLLNPVASSVSMLSLEPLLELGSGMATSTEGEGLEFSMFSSCAISLLLPFRSRVCFRRGGFDSLNRFRKHNSFGSGVVDLQHAKRSTVWKVAKDSFTVV